MRQKGFATIFALCLILVIALIVRSIQEAEANHAREVVNFETEQALQLAAESGIVKAADFVRQNPEVLPYSKAQASDKVPIHVNSPYDNITVEVWGERGKIYRYYKSNDNKLKLSRFNTNAYQADGKVVTKAYCDGFYLMSRATIDKGFFGEKIYRRAYAYVIDDAELSAEYDQTKIYFMELPTEGDGIIKKNS